MQIFLDFRSPKIRISAQFCLLIDQLVTHAKFVTGNHIACPARVLRRLGCFMASQNLLFRCRHRNFNIFRYICQKRRTSAHLSNPLQIIMNLSKPTKRPLRIIFAIALTCCMAQAYANQSKLHTSNANDKVAVVVAEDHSTDFDFNNVTFVGIVAFMISLGSLVYTYKSYRSQRSTEVNTMNVPIEHQRNKFKDLSRHTYRNLVCTFAAAIKYFDPENGEEQHRLAYPSESNLLKLKVQPEDVVMEINPAMAASVSELRLLLRNYNIEIEVASQHLSRQNISDSAIYQDFDNLLFKPLYLVMRAYSLENDLVSLSQKKKTNDDNNKELLHRTMSTIVEEHFKKIKSGLSHLINKPELHRHIGKLDASGESHFLGVDHTGAKNRSMTALFGKIYPLDAASMPDLQFIKNSKKAAKPTDDVITCKLEEKEYKLLCNNISDILGYIDSIRASHPEVYNELEAYAAMAEAFGSSLKINFLRFFNIALRLDAIVELRSIGMVNYD